MGPTSWEYPRNPGILRKYSRIHRLLWHGTSQDTSGLVHVLGIYGFLRMSRDRLWQHRTSLIKSVHTLSSTRYVPMDAMEISYTNTRAHTLHVNIVQPSLYSCQGNKSCSVGLCQLVFAYNMWQQSVTLRNAIPI